MPCEIENCYEREQVSVIIETQDKDVKKKDGKIAAGKLGETSAGYCLDHYKELKGNLKILKVIYRAMRWAK